LDKPAPFVEVFTFRREDLYPVVVAVSDEDSAVRLPYAVRTVELAWTIARLAPRKQQLSIGAEFVDAGVTVAVRDIEVAVGRKGDVGGIVERARRADRIAVFFREPSIGRMVTLAVSQIFLPAKSNFKMTQGSRST
jgi:hypothetical protein